MEERDRIHVLEPRDVSDLREISEALPLGSRLLVNLADADEQVRPRLLGEMVRLVKQLGGIVLRAAEDVYFVKPFGGDAGGQRTS